MQNTNHQVTVGELISLLQEEPNKDKPVNIYLVGCSYLMPLMFYDIDFGIDDRMDFNVDETNALEIKEQ
jgi:hypothetical protein